MTEKNLSQIQEELEKSTVHQNKPPKGPPPINFEPSEQNEKPPPSLESSDNSDS